MLSLNRMIFIGYPSNSKGYKLYDLASKYIFVSRDVIFHEHIFPFDSQLTNFNSTGCFVIPHPISDINSSSPTSVHSQPSVTHNTSHVLTHNSSSFDTTISSSLDLPVSSPPIPTRHSTRVKHRLAYLQHYHCNLATQSALPISSTRHFSSKQHDISSFLGYHNLTQSYKHFSCSVSSHIEPKSFSQAVKSPQWRDVMATEISALEANKTWIITNLPPNKHRIGCKWVYKVKVKANGEIDHYKARLVAKGYTQCKGLDYYDTFALVAKLTTVRCLLALAAMKNWHLH